jgi:hypothetical protein
MGNRNDLPRICPATDRETTGNHPSARVDEALVRRSFVFSAAGRGTRRIKLIIRCSGCAALAGQPWCRSGSRLPVLGRCGLAGVTSFTVGDVVYAIWSRGHEPAAQSPPQPVWILKVPDPEQRPSRAARRDGAGQVSVAGPARMTEPGSSVGRGRCTPSTIDATGHRGAWGYRPTWATDRLNPI